MSFQHFRLGELSLHQPLPPHLAQHQHSAPPSTFPPHIDNTHNSFSNNLHKGHTSTSTTKQPYGSGDTDDGYTLVFPNLDAFHAWRNKEEETQMVEFVKGDTHGSKADPPRFKDHTKLVCARHSRSGRKKYIKKHPERVRKVPSRKLDGQGCLASISFKTYFDTDEVRACYVSQHSHEIGLANLPFTRRGRKAAVQQDKDRAKSNGDPTIGGGSISNGISSSSTFQPSQAIQPPPQLTSAVSMLAPLPAQVPYQTPPTYGFAQPHQIPQPYAPPQPLPHPSLSHERWENMATLFNSVRHHARGFEYPTASVAALETVLIRLYLESPVGLAPQPSVGAVMQNGMVPASGAPQSMQPPQQQNTSTISSGTDNSGTEESS